MKSIAPVYRYYLADLKTGAFVMEVPFGSVSWSRKVSGAGSFSGSISADPLQDNYDLYDTTMPGRYGLYVVRDGVCLWGGIIWGRQYDITSKVLKIDALELTSYLHHRTFWKSVTLPDGISIQAMLEKIIEYVTNDQKDVDDNTGYSASDLHNQITSYSQTGFIVTVTTTEVHGYNNGESVYIGGFSSSVTNGGQDYYNGETLISVDLETENSASNVFSFTVADDNGDTQSLENPIVGVAASVGPYSTILTEQNTVQASAGMNLTIDIDDDLKPWLITSSLSGDSPPFNFRGSDGKYVGEIIENFAAKGVPCYFQTDPTIVTDPGTAITSKRFDFYIESTFDVYTRTFSNVFKAWLVRKDNNDPTSSTEVAVPLGELYGPSKVAASNYIFEHPGNVVGISLSENSSNAGTRTWVIDNANAGGNADVAAKFYSSYTNLSYLEKDWALLDLLVTDREINAENDQQVFKHAFEIGYKNSPPIGEYSVTVNGSFDPEVGTYRPGDWCVLIPGDSFVSERLKPPYENRNNLLVRKISSFDVTVPDNPTFPEVVKLELVSEWEVSKQNLSTIAGDEPTSLLNLTIFDIDLSNDDATTYSYDGIDPFTPISLSVELKRNQGLANLAQAQAELALRTSAKEAFSVVNSGDYRKANNAVINAQQEVTQIKAALKALVKKGYKKKDKKYKQGLQILQAAEKVLAKKTADRNAITVTSTEEYKDLLAKETVAQAEVDKRDALCRIPSKSVTFQRQDALGDWNDLPSGTVLTNTNGQAIYNYIIDTPNLPESSREPQNRLPITHDNPYPQTKFRAVFGGQDQYAGTTSDEASLYIRTKYNFTYVPKYNNNFLVADSSTKIATTPLTAAQVATTFRLPQLTDRVITSAVVATNIATITTSTAHLFAVGDRVTLYNLTASSGYVDYTVIAVPLETTFTVAYTATNGSLTLGTSPVARFTAYPALNGARGRRVTGVYLAVAGWQTESARLRAAVWNATDRSVVALSGNTDVSPKLLGHQYIDSTLFAMTHAEEESLVFPDTDYLVGFKRNTSSSFSAQWSLDEIPSSSGVNYAYLYYDNRTSSNDIEAFDKDSEFPNVSLVYVINYEFVA
jgi:hypothetical protein